MAEADGAWSRVGIAGFGQIGQEVARRLSGGVPGVKLSGVAGRNPDRVSRVLRELGLSVPAVEVDQLAGLSDIVVECAPAAALPEIAAPVLRAGKEIVVLSAGALLEHPELIELAREHSGRITVPTGALLGLDAVGALAEGTIQSVRMTTRKPADSLAGAPFLEQRGIDPYAAQEAVKVFSGTARDAAAGFPANLNVAAALALAGAGPDNTFVEVWIDPAVTRNTHTIEVRSDFASVSMTIENIPSENPRTARITAPSVVRLLRKRHAVLSVGT